RLTSVYFFFFSSRRRHTRSKRDWSSDVCSSDLKPCENLKFKRVEIMKKSKFLKKSLAMLLALMLVVAMIPLGAAASTPRLQQVRSEERRVGKECRGGGARGH